METTAAERSRVPAKKLEIRLRSRSRVMGNSATVVLAEVATEPGSADEPGALG
jgi:hypothetical protein